MVSLITVAVPLVLYAPLAYYDLRFRMVPKRLFEGVIVAMVIASWLLYHSWQILLAGFVITAFLMAVLWVLRRLYKTAFLEYADIAAIGALAPVLWNQYAMTVVILTSFMAIVYYRINERAKTTPYMLAIYFGLIILAGSLL